MNNLYFTLKSKIVFLCITMSLFMVSVFSFYLYYNAKKIYDEKQLVTLSSKLNTVVASIDQDYYQIIRLSTSLSNDKTITSFLSTPEPEIKNSSFFSLTAYEQCSRLAVNLGISDLLTKGMLVSDINHRQIHFGFVYGDSSDYDTFVSIIPNDTVRFSSGIQKNPFYYGTEDYIIPFYTPIYSSLGVRETGKLYLATNADIITKHFQSMDIEANGILYLIIDNHMYSYDGTRITDISDKLSGMDLSSFRSLDSQTLRTGPLEAFNGKDYLMVKSNATGWILMQQIPTFLFDFKDAASLFQFPVYLAFFVVCLIFYFYLDHLINKPITAIISQLNHVSAGDYCLPEKPLRSKEFNMIQEEIGLMSQSINELLISSVENEKQKSAYEFKILQSQINPHFLYNTLNSIRWLGEINGVTGISEISTALASLLHSIANIHLQFVTMEAELSFIRDYITIQSYRYGNAFSIEYKLDSPELANARIIKFALQPLVENSIFHGIEPSGHKGLIEIHVFTNDNILYIQVRDNGIGIPEERLQQIRKMELPVDTKDIGLSNIHHRLQLEYGQKYGLFIESQYKSYTLVTIKIPLEYMPERTDA